MVKLSLVLGIKEMLHTVKSHKNPDYIHVTPCHTPSKPDFSPTTCISDVNSLWYIMRKETLQAVKAHKNPDYVHVTPCYTPSKPDFSPTTCTSDVSLWYIMRKETLQAVKLHRKQLHTCVTPCYTPLNPDFFSCYTILLVLLHDAKGNASSCEITQESNLHLMLYVTHHQTTFISTIIRSLALICTNRFLFGYLWTLHAVKLHRNGTCSFIYNDLCNKPSNINSKPIEPECKRKIFWATKVNKQQ
jgi:hypothetical protein